MLSGATPKAEEMAGTAVLRIVVSRDSMKKATATSHGKIRLAASDRAGKDEEAINGAGGFIRKSFGRAHSHHHVSSSACSGCQALTTQTTGSSDTTCTIDYNIRSMRQRI
jgi:hypothetical protein